MASMHSALWHRVEHLRPRLKPQVVIERHVIRQQVWYVAQDRLSSRSHRMSQAAYGIVMRLDGHRTVAQAWSQALAAMGEEAPSQDQLVHLLGRLYALELLQSDGAVDTRELGERSSRIERQLKWQRMQNPLFLRLPLADPDRFLNATVHLVRPLFSWIGALLWLTVVGWLTLQAALHWDALTSNVLDRVLARDNLVLLLLVFPALKILHELGHAYATKVFGGEVHDVGIMFLVFVPVPYVDASRSAAFPGKWHRALVGAAGMMTELVVAAAAMAIWIHAEPGLVRALAFNTLFIAGVSTLAFNANPLLRFDGYFILSDLIEVPNLGSRANQYWAYLVQRYAFGVAGAHSPVEAAGERLVFLLYAPIAYAWRLVVLSGITLAVGSQYFFFGVAMAIWTVMISLAWPALKALRFVLLAPALTGRRFRAAAVTFALAGGAVLALFGVPVPHGTVARAVVSPPDDSRIVAETQGRFVRLAVEQGQQVARGTPLMTLEDPYLRAQLDRQRGRLAELEYRLTAAETLTPYDVQIIRRQIELVRSELADAEQKVAALTIKAGLAGVVHILRPADLDGVEVKKGHLFGFVLPDQPAALRVAVPESDIDTVRTGTGRIAVRLDGMPWTEIADVKRLRERPGSTRQLPSPALAEQAGGPLPVDPSAKEGDTTLLPFFEIDIELPAALRTHLGERAWVRFDHGAQPLAERVWRSLRQLFLRQFNA